MYTLREGRIIEGIDGWYVPPRGAEAHYVYEGDLLCGASWFFGYDPVFVRPKVSYCPLCRHKLTLLSAGLFRQIMYEYREGRMVVVTLGHFTGRIGRIETAGTLACCVLLDGDRTATTFFHDEIKPYQKGAENAR